MNKEELLNKLNIKVSSIKKIGKVEIINDSHVIKKMNRKSDFYDYLKTRKFINFPPVYTNIGDEVEITKYIKEKDIPDEQKLEDLSYLTSILHLDTTFDKNMDIDKIKEIYESTIDRLNELSNYYHNLQNIIEEEIYMSPANYLLIRNISLIYKSLNLSRSYLDKWYKIVEKNNSLRYAYIHGNLRKEHLIEKDNLYLISWDKSLIDFPIKDLEILYRNSFMDVNISDILAIYENKYSLKKEEKYLLFNKILIPERIEFNCEEYLKTKNIGNMILYLEKTYKYLEDYSKKTDNNTNKQQ